MTSFDVAYMFESIPKIIKAFPLTVLMTVVSMIGGLIFGMILAMMAMSNCRVLRKIIEAYVNIIRGIPILLLLLILYFAVPQLLSAVNIDINGWHKLTFAIITFTITTSVASCEAFRSAYGSIDKGQHEAGASIGLTGFQVWYRIITPQAMYVVLPNLFNLLITLFKDTSLAFSLGIMDMMGIAKVLDANTYGMKRLEIYMAVALIYWFITAVMEFLASLGEKRLAKGSVGMSAAASGKGG